MPLLRGFSKVDEEGKVFIPSNIREKTGISAGHSVEIKVIRIKGSNRWPHIVVHAPGVYPQLSMLQMIMMQEEIQIDNEAKLILTDNALEETKLQPNSRVELKVTGPNHGSWLVIHNRGPNRLTTLQEKIGRQGKGGRDGKKWKSMPIEY